MANLTVPNIAQVNDFIAQHLSMVRESTNQAKRSNVEWKPPSFPDDYPKIDLASSEAFRITNHKIWVQEAEYVAKCMNRRLNSIHALLDSLTQVAQRRAELGRRHSDELIQASNSIDKAAMPLLVQQHKVFAPLLTDGNRREAVQLQHKSFELDRLRMNDELFTMFKPYVRSYGDEILGKAQGQIDTVCKIHDELLSLHGQKPANYPYQQGSYLWENKYRHYWNAYVAASTMGCLDDFILGVEGIECRGWAKIVHYVKKYCLIVSCTDADIPTIDPEENDENFADYLPLMGEPWKSIVTRMAAHDPMATQISIASTTSSPSSPPLPITEFPVLAGTPPVLCKSVVLRPPTNALWATGTEWKDGVLVLTLAGEMLCFTFDGEIEPRWAVRLGNAHVRMDLCNLTLAAEEIPHETWWVKELNKLTSTLTSQPADSFIVKIVDMEDFEKWRDGIADAQSSARRNSYGNEMRGRVTYEDNVATVQMKEAVAAAEEEAQKEIRLQLEREAKRTPPDHDSEQDLGSGFDALSDHEYHHTHSMPDSADDPSPSRSHVEEVAPSREDPVPLPIRVSRRSHVHRHTDDDVDNTVDKDVYAARVQRSRSASEDTVKVEREDGDENDVNIDDHIDDAGFATPQGKKIIPLQPAEVSGSAQERVEANGEGTSTSSGRREKEENYNVLPPTPCIFSGKDPVFDQDASLQAGYGATLYEDTGILNRSKTVFSSDQASTSVGYATIQTAPQAFFDNASGDAEIDEEFFRPNKTIIGEDELEDVDLSNNPFELEESDDKETPWTPLPVVAPIFPTPEHREELPSPLQSHFTDCEEATTTHTIIRTSKQTIDSGVDVTTVIPTESEFRSRSSSLAAGELPTGSFHVMPDDEGEDDDVPLAGALATIGSSTRLFLSPIGATKEEDNINTWHTRGDDSKSKTNDSNTRDGNGNEKGTGKGNDNDNVFKYTPAVNYVTLDDDDNENETMKGIKTTQPTSSDETTERNQNITSIAPGSVPKFNPDSVD